MKLKVLHHDRFTNRDGENVNRLELDVRGHNVQVLQFNERPIVLVFVDQRPELVEIKKAGAHVARRTRKG